MKDLAIALWLGLLVTVNSVAQTQPSSEPRYPPLDGPPKIDLRDGLPGSLPQPPRQPLLPPAAAQYPKPITPPAPPGVQTGVANGSPLTPTEPVVQQLPQVPPSMPLPMPPFLIPSSPLFAPPVVLPANPALTSGLEQALRELRTAREELARERQQATASLTGPSTEEETARLKLRLRVVELLREMNKTVAKPSEPGLPATSAPVEPIRPPRIEVTPKVGDPLELAQTRFRAGQFQEALKALESIDRSELTRRDQVWVQYLMACCLRQLGKLGEAAALYREVAASRDDPFLTDSAVWHLSFLRWREETQSAINELRR